MLFLLPGEPRRAAPKFCLPSIVRSAHPLHNPAFNTTIFCLNSPYTPRLPVVLTTLHSSCSRLLYNNNSNAPFRKRPSAYKDIRIRISSFHLSLSFTHTHTQKNYTTCFNTFNISTTSFSSPRPPPPHNLSPPPQPPQPPPL